MKRGWTKKVKAVPACAASNDALEGRFKPVQPKVKRRVRTSAAMVGLVISMGAPNLLLTRQSDRAPAAEAIGNEPTLSIPAATTEAAQSDNVNSVVQAVSVPVLASSSAVVPPISQVQQRVAATPPAPSVSEDPVQERHSRVLTQKYQVDEASPATLSVPAREQQHHNNVPEGISNLAQPKALASSEDVEIKIAPANSNTQHAEIQAEKILKSQRVTRLVQKLKDAQSETLSKSDEVKSTQITPTAAPAAVSQALEDESGTFNVEVNSAISIKQRVLINRLKQKSNPSQDTLSHQKRSEESSNPSGVAILGQPSPKASLAPVVVEVERRNAALLSPNRVTSNENSEFELQQLQDSPAIGTFDRQDLAAQSRSEASVKSVVVEAERQNAALVLPTSLTSENSGFGLQQLPPAVTVGIIDGASDPAPNASTLAPTSVGNTAEENVAEGTLKGKPPYSPNAKGNAKSLTDILRQAALPIATSNENSGFELQQSPPAATVGILDGSDSAPNASTLAPGVVANTAGENVARTLKDKPSYSPNAKGNAKSLTGILRQAASPIATSNDAVLEAQDVQLTPSSAVVVPDVQDAVVNEPTVVDAASLGYQVKAGDTLSAIARNHGIPLSEIVKANRLSNPDLIEINQQITIPTFQYSAVGQTITVINRPTQPATTASTVASTQKTVLSQSVFVVPPLSPSANHSSVSISTLPMTNKIQTNTELIASNPAGAQQEIGIPPEPLAKTPSPGAAYSGMGGSISDENQLSTPASSQTQLPNSTKLESPSNLYVQDLQTDIQKLQQKYYAQHRGSKLVPIVNETTTVSTPTQVPVRATVAIRSPGNPQTSPNTSASQPINPEFRVAQTTEDLQPNLQKQTLTQTSSVVRSKTKSSVATAPSNVDASEAIESFQGRQVSPDLPPLGAVDNYLPKPTTSPLKGYIWPAKGVLTSGYGWRWGRMHRGIDIAAPIGTPVVAAAPGVVVRSGWNKGGYGKLVEVKHGDGSFTRYAHNNRLRVQPGETVEQGQLIAEMGSTGFSTGPHSHFEIHPGGKSAVNPIAFLPKR